MAWVPIQLAAGLAAMIAHVAWQVRNARSVRRASETELRRLGQLSGLPWPEAGDADTLIARTVVERRLGGALSTPVVALLAAAVVGLIAVLTDPNATDLAAYWLLIVGAMSTVAIVTVVAPLVARWRVGTVRAVANLHPRRLTDYLTRRSLATEAMAATVVLATACIATWWVPDTAARAIVALGVLTLLGALAGQQQLLRARSGVSSADGLLWDEFQRIRGLYRGQNGLVMAAIFVPQGVLLAWHPAAGLRFLAAGLLTLVVATAVLALVIGRSEGSDRGAAARARALLGRPGPDAA